MMRHFLAQNGQFAPNKNFLGKIFIIIFIDPFHCAEFWKNSYSGSRVMRMRHFLAQNDPFTQTIFFSENLLIKLVPFIHAYLQSRNQIQISIY